MRALKRIVGVLLLVFLAALLVAGCSAGERSNKPGVDKEQAGEVKKGEDDGDFAELLTLDETIQALSDQGLGLSPLAVKAGKTFAIRGLEPEVFAIEGTDAEIFVYVFLSIEERRKAVTRPALFPDDFPEGFRRQGSFAHAFPAKNTLIVYFDPEMTHEESREQPSLSKTAEAFWQLNHGQKMAFKGRSANWEGELELRYYANLWKDGSGRIRDDNYSAQKGLLRYTGNKPGEVGMVTYKVDRGSGESGGRCTLKDDGTIPLFSTGSGFIPSKDDCYSVTIEWNGNLETFELRAAVE